MQTFRGFLNRFEVLLSRPQQSGIDGFELILDDIEQYFIEPAE